MLKIKDFKPGQRVYIVYYHTGTNRAPEIIETTVKSVGRVYVNTSYYDKRFKVHGTNYLLEYSEYGECGYLFRTYEEADEAKKRDVLLSNIRRVYYSYLEKCSNEELYTIMICLKKASYR